MIDRIASIVGRHKRGQKTRSLLDFHPNGDDLAALEKILVPLSRAQKNLVRAYGLFAKLKTPRITPDGLIGGRGFVMPLKDVKAMVHQTVEEVATVVDALVDEIFNNPIWANVRENSRQTVENLSELEEAAGLFEEEEDDTDESDDEILEQFKMRDPELEPEPPHSELPGMDEAPIPLMEVNQNSPMKYTPERDMQPGRRPSF
jgi:hypothetical protein